MPEHGDGLVVRLAADGAGKDAYAFLCAGRRLRDGPRIPNVFFRFEHETADRASAGVRCAVFFPIAGRVFARREALRPLHPALAAGIPRGTALRAGRRGDHLPQLPFVRDGRARCAAAVGA